MMTLLERVLAVNISRTTILHFQDLCLFPGLSRPGNLNILISGLFRVCKNSAGSFGNAW